VAPEYAFHTVFALDAPVEDVFDAVLAPDRWLPDLPHVRDLERLDPGGADAARVRYRTAVAAPLSPYRLRWEMEAVRVVTPDRIEWQADGDLAGRGSWELIPLATGTEVTSVARLRTTRWWMALLEPVARPLFVRNHDVVMRAGIDTLADHLGAAVTRYERGDGLTVGR
jgi:uncharacterized protein YndB with AHSA1/START domain